MDWSRMPSLASLRAFAAVAEAGTLAAAGRKLNVSHAAISQQVRALEAYLGAELVVREGRGLALTQEGRALAGHLDEAFSLMHRAVAELTDADRTRPLQVTMTPTFAVSWLMPRISEFRHRHPDIELMLNPTADVVELEPGGVDLAIRFGKGQWRGLNSEPLLLTGFVVVAARSLVGDADFTDLTKLREYPWLQELGANESANWWDRQGIAPNRGTNLHLPGYMMLESLRRGDGVTAAARAFIEPEIRSGHLRVLFEDEERGNGYHLVTRPGVQRPPLKTFIAWLRSHRDGQGAVSG